MVSLLPKILQDESNQALEKASANVLDVDMSSMMIYLIDHLDSKYLPLLAENFHILGDEGWNFCETEKEKRELLKAAIPLHQYKGTKYAVLRVLDVMNLNGTLEQWFEYDGIPYHFKLVLKVFDKKLDEETEIKLLRLINIFKNKRSILDSIEAYITSNVAIKFYSKALIGKVYTVRPKRINK